MENALELIAIKMINKYDEERENEISNEEAICSAMWREN